MSFSFIHDPEFEADFIEDNYEDNCEETFEERLSDFNEQYMNINNLEEIYVRALIRDLFDLYDHAEEENELLYIRESIYLICKSLVTPVGRECLKKDKDFLETCILRTELTLELIDNKDERDDYIDENDYNAWEKTATSIIDFLNVANKM